MKNADATQREKQPEQPEQQRIHPPLTRTTDTSPRGGSIQGFTRGGTHESNKAALRGQTDELLIKDVHSSPARQPQHADDRGDGGVINSPPVRQADRDRHTAPGARQGPRAEPGSTPAFWGRRRKRRAVKKTSFLGG